MFIFNMSLAVLLSVTLLLSEKKLQAEADECSSNSDCSGSNYYCCKQRYSWVSSVCRYGGCVGQSCSSNSDCGGLFEKCCSSTNLCATSSCPECSSNTDCGYNKYCCKQRYFSQSHVCGSGGCVGQSCSLKSDCGGPGECCLNNVCTKSGCIKTASPHECSDNSDCGYNQYCCQRYSYQSNVCGYGGCVGQSCSSDSDCGGPGECCSSSDVCTKSGCTNLESTTTAFYGCFSNSDCPGFYNYCCRTKYIDGSHCSSSCVNKLCNSDRDCGGPSECCKSSNYCTESGCDHHVTKALASWLIAVIVVSVLVAVVIPIVIVVCFYRGMASASRGRTQQGQVLNQPPVSTIALQNIQTLHNNPVQLQNPPYSPLPYFDQGQDQDAPSPKPLNQVPPPAYTEYNIYPYPRDNQVSCEQALVESTSRQTYIS